MEATLDRFGRIVIPKKIHAYQESAHKFEKNDFLTVSKPNIPIS